MKEVIKYLAGGAVVYCVAAACGNYAPDLRHSSAHAAPTESACNKCSASGSPHGANPDSDPKQWVGGIVSTDSNIELGVGPFYLTDVRAVEATSRLYLVDSTQACVDTAASAKELWTVASTTVAATVVNQGPAHGMRFLVKAGQKLCLKDLGGFGVSIAWAGFRPYS
jgi:hypothetical protein